MITKKQVLAYLTKKLGHTPTSAELIRELNGQGLISIHEEIKKQRKVS